MKINKGWLEPVNPNQKIKSSPSPHFDARPNKQDISLLVIHNISLPPGEFAGNYIEDFFLGKLNPLQHEYFEQIAALKVSSHLLIRRDASLIQFVSFDDRAWHAGESCFEARQRCNDFSIGIELEGVDDICYTEQQYQQLITVSKLIMQSYPLINPSRIVGHSDIAPHRKTDPGSAFDWQRYLLALTGSRN